MMATGKEAMDLLVSQCRMMRIEYKDADTAENPGLVLSARIALKYLEMSQAEARAEAAEAERSYLRDVVGKRLVKAIRRLKSRSKFRGEKYEAEKEAHAVTRAERDLWKERAAERGEAGRKWLAERDELRILLKDCGVARDHNAKVAIALQRQLEEARAVLRELGSVQHFTYYGGIEYYVCALCKEDYNDIDNPIHDDGCQLEAALAGGEGK